MTFKLPGLANIISGEHKPTDIPQERLQMSVAYVTTQPNREMYVGNNNPTHTLTVTGGYDDQLIQFLRGLIAESKRGISLVQSLNNLGYRTHVN